MPNIRQITNNAVIGVAQSVVSGVVLFLLYKYLITRLGTEQLGLWSVLLAGISIARLGDMGLSGSVLKFVAKYRAKNDGIQAAKAIETAAISIAVVMGLLILIAYPALKILITLVIPATLHLDALSILPWACLSLWLASVAGVFQFGLDGCHRIDIRNILLMLGNLALLALSYICVPQHGLLGLAWAQVLQFLLLAITNWIALKRQIAQLSWLPNNWSKTEFKEMFGYALNFQVSSIAILFIDPITKLLISLYGNLSSTAHYELASQFVIRLRALLVAANEALVPAVAEMHATEPSYIRNLYIQAYRVMLFLLIPFYGAMIVALPLVSQLWLGNQNAQFIFFGVLSAIGWAANTLSVPGYFVNQGTGDLIGNSISHVVIAILNLTVSSYLGHLYGEQGVVYGLVFSLFVGSGIIVSSVHKRYLISASFAIQSESLCLLLSVLASVTLVFIFYQYNKWTSNLTHVYFTYIFVYSLFIGSLLWIHPYRKKILDVLQIRKISK